MSSSTSVPSSRLGRSVAVPAIVTALVVTLLAFAPQAHAQKVRPDFFGVHMGKISTGVVPPVPVGSVRLWDTPGTKWYEIENEPGLSPSEWQWDFLDKAVNTARDNQIKPVVVLGQTPQFYAKDPNAAGLKPGASSMPNMRKWKRYVTAVVKRYGTSADYQVWNEPNVKNYWSGSPGQMAKLTKTAYQAVNRVAKRAKVVSPSMPLRLSSQRRWFNRYWNQKVGRKPVGRFVEIVGMHAYPAADQRPEHSMAHVRYARKIMARERIRKPMWNMEINYGLLGGDTAKDIPQSLEAAYVGRTFILNAFSPIKRVYWYRWDMPYSVDAEGRERSIANTLLAVPGPYLGYQVLREAGVAYQEVRDWLLRTKTKSCKQARNGLYTCTAIVNRTQGRKFYWRPTRRSVKVRLPKGTHHVSRLDGTTTDARRGQRIRVGKSPVMVSYRR